ncbi:MAG: hypothetical protein ACREO0_05485 [Pseudoxanthomonas sp.]
MTGLTRFFFTFPGFSGKTVEVMAETQEAAEVEALYITGQHFIPEGTLITSEAES